MIMYMVILLMAYFVFSLFFTGLYVRYTDNGVAKFLRKHFYLFPFFPVATPLLIVSWALWKTGCLIFRVLRYAFEAISGKKTYRRRSRYYRS